MNQPKQRCPHCGVWKVGLADHIRDKHGPCAITGAQQVVYRPPPAQPKRVVVMQLDCPECGAPMQLRKSVYGLFYGCTRYPHCKGSHGAHANGMPLGTPADDRTKKMRMAAHNAFDPLWRGPNAVFKDRTEAYAWMQKTLGKSPEDAHIGRFDRDDCKKLVEAIWANFGD